ncbi:MAG: 1,4-dihydroxy-2-naphthoate polyprenyltransferase [Puniceicoccaceae bacterium]
METWKHWMLAARPKTLPAAAVPVLVGGALAAAADLFSLLPWLICLAFSLLIQVGTNYANDYYDFRKGADDERRIGPMRAVASGWISPEAMYRGMVLVFVLAFLIGSLLVFWGGWWLVLVGIVSIICGIAYTGGPYPLGYNGWGDVFVFIFFGWVATCLTYYVQAGSFVVMLPSGTGVTWSLLAGMVPGALATNLLVVNNVRDEPLDRQVGKRTLAVRWGKQFGLAQYGVLSLLALVVPLAFATVGGQWGCLCVLPGAPLLLSNYRLLAKATDRDGFERVLVRTALALLLVGGLFCLGLLLSW